MSILPPLIIIAVIVMIVGWAILKLMGAKAQRNLCDSCAHELATCPGVRTVFACDLDPSLRGADADRVLTCGSYLPDKEVQP